MEPGAVSPADLGRLADLHAILFALGDPAAAIPRVAALCAALPPLAHRLMALARRRAPVRRAPADLPAALAIVGNRGLEEVLLGLLEDLTVLKYDLESHADAPAQAPKR